MSALVVLESEHGGESSVFSGGFIAVGGTHEDYKEADDDDENDGEDNKSCYILLLAIILMFYFRFEMLVSPPTIHILPLYCKVIQGANNDYSIEFSCFEPPNSLFFLQVSKHLRPTCRNKVCLQAHSFPCSVDPTNHKRLLIDYPNTLSDFTDPTFF